jgi:hypothetical protein
MNRGSGGPPRPRPEGRRGAEKPGFGPRRSAQNQARAGHPAPARPRPPVGPDARRIALDALINVTASGAYSTLALDERLRKSRIDPWTSGWPPASSTPPLKTA